LPGLTALTSSLGLPLPDVPAPNEPSLPDPVFATTTFGAGLDGGAGIDTFGLLEDSLAFLASTAA
jgi:hypothetical protein